MKTSMYKIFMVLFLFISSVYADKISIVTKATASFEEGGVQKQIYSNDYQLSIDRQLSKTLLKPNKKKALWLDFENVSKSVVGMGEFVLYTLKVENISKENIEDIQISVNLPRGFRYAPKSYRVVDSDHLSNAKVENNTLLLSLNSLKKESSKTVEFVLQVGVASIKEAVVTATAKANNIFSNEAQQIINIKNSELMRGKSTIVGSVLANGTPVKNVRIYMEDGTFTLTDYRGRYSFAGIDEGTHVVQLDRDSLKEAYTVGSCEKSVRFAGSKVSQFVKTFNGTMNRTDFCLNIKDEYKQHIRLFPKFASLDDKLDSVAKETIAEALKDVDITNIDSIIVEGHSDSQKINKNNKFKNNTELALARAKSVKKYLGKYLNIGLDKITVYSFGDKKPISSNKTKEGRAKNRRVELTIIKINKDGDTKNEDEFIINKKRVQMPKYNKDLLAKQSDKIEFIWPTKDFVPSISAVNLAVKHKEEQNVHYIIDGKSVDPIYFKKKIIDDMGKAVTIYRGVHLKEGDNQVVCEIKDGDTVVKRLEKTIHFSSMPVRAKVLKQYSNLVADGKHTPVIAVKFFDRDGYPVRGDVIGKFKISQPYKGYRRLDKLGFNPLSKSTTGEDYVIGDGGIAYIRLEATTKAGEAVLSLPFEKRTEELKVWLKPKVRDWILVGFAEGSVGYTTISKNMESKKIDTHNQVSLFAKGRVLGSYLMTISYNSKKGKKELLDIIDPNRYYTIYGDDSVRGVDAPSQKKLYLKIEKDNFYAMFGDFVTGFNDMKLSAYNRTLNGVNAEYNGDKIQTQLFGSDSDHNFVRDEIKADGTSGLYHLSNKKIIINSEKITIETRDRFQPDRVLKRESMSPLVDYNIDYLNGTIYFKKPIFSRDKNFNPIYIVVNYEVNSNGDSMTAGARVSVNLLDNRLKLSSTYIKEDLGEQDRELSSVDIRLKVAEQGKLEVEYAKSSSSEIVGKRDAFRVEYEHNGENFYTNAYYKKVDKDFGLKQQSAEDLDLEKIGVESNYKLDTNMEAKAKLYRDKTISTGDINDIAEAIVAYNLDTVQLEGGTRYINEHNGKEKTAQLIAGVNKSFFDNKLTLRAKREESIQSSTSEQFPDRTIVGAEVQVTEHNTVFVEHEKSDRLVKELTRVGVTSEPWSGARVQTSIADKIGDGDRLFSSMGIQQSMVLSKNINIDLGVDRAETMEGDRGDDFTAYSSSLNYHKDKITSSLKVEYKDTKEQNSISIAMALATASDSGLELSTAVQYFKSDNQDETIYTDISVADRPFESNYAILDKFHYIDEKSEGLQSRKFVNDFNFNYKLASTFELSLYYGIKHVVESIKNEKYNGLTQMAGLSATYDMSQYFDLTLYSNVIDGASTLNQQEYNHGIALGWNVHKNINLIFGYNFEGFEDNDFSSGTKTKEGAYIGFRMKFE